MPRVTVDWIKDHTFLGKDESGHALILDIPASGEESGVGIRPALLPLMGLAGCMGYDIVSILAKKRLTPDKLSIEVTSEHVTDYPRRVEHITVWIAAEGELPATALSQAFELSQKKYCSVLATFLTPPEIDFQLTLNSQPV
jgi:putative redox protein